MSLKGQVALVTGAGQGIGAAIVRVLARQGATVIGTDINERGVERINGLLAEVGALGRGIIMDVREIEQIETGIAAIEKEFGSVYVLVNNAGITRDNLTMRMKDEEWDAVIDTNLKSVFRMSRAVMRGMMKARAGRIINISSVIGLIGNAGQCNYAASKAGLIGFTQSVAKELASRGITVNAIAPGFIETDMTSELKPEMREAILKQIPLGSFGSADDIAGAALFLAGPLARYITGQILTVDGGMVM